MMHRKNRRSREMDQRLLYDPVMQLVGVGREIWQDESGDKFIERLRAEWLIDDLGDSEVQADRQVRGLIV